ncbi:hypothetical protein D3C73_861340 [compost metagenome]
MTVVSGQFHRAVRREYQDESVHAGEMHADDARPQDQAGAEFDQLMLRTGTVTQATGQQQGGKTRPHGDHDGKTEQQRLVVRHGVRTHGRHAHVMHGGDAQANADRGLHVLPDAQSRLAEGVHRQPGGEQGDQ